MNATAALLTLVATGMHWWQMIARAHEAHARNPNYTAPWHDVVRVLRRSARRGTSRARALARRVFRLPATVAKGDATIGHGLNLSARSRAIVGERGSVEHRLATVDHRVTDVEAQVDKLDTKVRRWIDHEHHAGIATALAPDWRDFIGALVLAAATFAAVTVAVSR